MCVAALMSGYAPISEGWFEFLGHGIVKNWKWLWGTTTWMDTLRDTTTWGADIGALGAFGGVSEKALTSIVQVIRNVYDTLQGRPGSIPLQDVQEVGEIYELADKLLADSSEGGGARGEYQRFMEAFNGLPKRRLFKKGFRHRDAEEMERDEPGRTTQAG